MKFTLLERDRIRDISPEILDAHGRLRILSAAYYQSTTAHERGLAAQLHALYGLHTTECVEWVSQRIAGRTALEIGAGNGVLAQALGIRATDSHMQAQPKYKALYENMAQPVITYGDHVEKKDALAVVRQYRPQVVVACWVTHRYDARQHWRGGNEVGVDEGAVLRHCEEYIFIGNREVHQNKPIWPPPEMIEPDWLYSRAVNSSPNFIAVWKGKHAKS